MTDDGVDGPLGPFVFRGRLTEDDAADLQCCICRVTFRKPVRWLAVVAGLAAAGYASADVAFNGPDFPAIACLVGVAVIAIVLPLVPSWTARSVYRRHQDQFLEAEVRLTSELVSITTDAFRSELDWSLLGGVADDPRGLMFYDKGLRALFWLPERLFEGETRRRVLALASLNGVRVHRT